MNPPATMHSGSKWLKPAKIRSSKVNLPGFTCKFLQIYIANCRFRLLHFTFKICQTVAGTSITIQFHIFLEFIFGGFLLFAPNCATRQSASPSIACQRAPNINMTNSPISIPTFHDPHLKFFICFSF